MTCGVVPVPVAIAILAAGSVVAFVLSVMLGLFLDWVSR